MAHGISLLTAAQALDVQSQGLAGPGLAVVVLAVVLGVAAMFWALFLSPWLRPGDPTDVMEQRRRSRFPGLWERAA